MDIDQSLRGPEAYALARQAIDQMAEQQVWPTPLNFELWLHYVADPEGELGREIKRMKELGIPVTEEESAALASKYLPRLRMNDEIRDAGDQLSHQLDVVTQAIRVAQKSNAAYGATLAGASDQLAGKEPPAMQELVVTLTAATRRVQEENSTLEQRLNDSTQEVQRLREHLEQVRRDAMTDALTNLPNRKSFDEGLARAIERPDAAGEALCVAVLDIDHFKKFNDTWGHQTGDQVLRYVASIIGRHGASPRLAARYGGEEFAILFPAEKAEDAAAVLEKIRVEIASRSLKRRSTNEDLGTVTISSGVAQRRPGEAAAALIERADAALYASKHSGRNRVTNAERRSAAAA